jgi:hypothetical protein
MDHDRFKEGYTQGNEDKQREWTEAFGTLCELPEWVKPGDPVDIAKHLAKCLIVVRGAQETLEALTPRADHPALAIRTWGQ